MIICCIMCGIAVGLSVWAAWGVQKNTQILKMLTEMSYHFGSLYETVNFILDYLLKEQSATQECDDGK